MTLTLGPRIYGKILKWGVLPGNKLDTFTAQPVINTALEEKVSYTQEVTQVIVKGASQVLPVPLTTHYDKFGAANNYESGQPTTIC